MSTQHEDQGTPRGADLDHKAARWWNLRYVACLFRGHQPDGVVRGGDPDGLGGEMWCARRCGSAFRPRLGWSARTEVTAELAGAWDGRVVGEDRAEDTADQTTPRGIRVHITAGDDGAIDPQDAAWALRRKDPVTRRMLWPESVTVDDGEPWTPDQWVEKPGVNLYLQSLNDPRGRREDAR